MIATKNYYDFISRKGLITHQDSIKMYVWSLPTRTTISLDLCNWIVNHHIWLSLVAVPRLNFYLCHTSPARSILLSQSSRVTSLITPTINSHNASMITTMYSRFSLIIPGLHAP